MSKKTMNWLPILLMVIFIFILSGCKLGKQTNDVNHTKNEKNNDQIKRIPQKSVEKPKQDQENKKDNQNDQSIAPDNIIPNLGLTNNKQLSWWIRRVPDAAPGIDPGYKSLMERYNGLYIGNTAKKQIALTFDVGDAGNESVPALLDMLKKHDVRANFFVAGKWVEKYPQVFSRIVEEGHLVGNHSYSHPDLTTISLDQVTEEINKTNNLIIKYGGQKPVFFRPPFGIFSETVLNKLYTTGYYTTFWGISMADWKPMTQEQLVHGVTDYLHNGAIAILHVTPDGVKALDTTIPEIKARGYEIVTLNQLLKK